jgi:hypothetical protein
VTRARTGATVGRTWGPQWTGGLVEAQGRAHPGATTAAAPAAPAPPAKRSWCAGRPVGQTAPAAGQGKGGGTGSHGTRSVTRHQCGLQGAAGGRVIVIVTSPGQPHQARPHCPPPGWGSPRRGRHQVPLGWWGAQTGGPQQWGWWRGLQSPVDCPPPSRRCHPQQRCNPHHRPRCSPPPRRRCRCHQPQYQPGCQLSQPRGRQRTGLGQAQVRGPRLPHPWLQGHCGEGGRGPPLFPGACVKESAAGVQRTCWPLRPWRQRLQPGWGVRVPARARGRPHLQRPGVEGWVLPCPPPPSQLPRWGTGPGVTRTGHHPGTGTPRWGCCPCSRSWPRQTRHPWCRRWPPHHCAVRKTVPPATGRGPWTCHGPPPEGTP